jgi:hypothetical protein
MVMYLQCRRWREARQNQESTMDDKTCLRSISGINKSAPNLTKTELQHHLDMGKLLQTKAPEKIDI